jgi:hypothetical protein
MRVTLSFSVSSRPGLLSEAQVRNITDLERMLAAAEEELSRLNASRKDILEQIDKLNREKTLLYKKSSESSDDIYVPMVNGQSSVDAKIALFRTLFRGREDVNELGKEAE